MPFRTPSRSRRQPVSTDKRFRRKNPHSDFGPSERWQHSGRILCPTEKPGVVAALATESSVIDILVTRRLLSARHNRAALRFKSDYHRAGLSPHITGTYAPAIAKTGSFAARDRTDAEEAAYHCWRLAVKVLGPRDSGLVITTLCHDISPTSIDIPRLQDALERLADWYGHSRQ